MHGTHTEDKNNEVSGNEPVCVHDGNLFNHHQQLSSDHKLPVQQDILLSVFRSLPYGVTDIILR